MSGESYLALRTYIKTLKRALILDSFHNRYFHDFPIFNGSTLFHNTLASFHLDRNYLMKPIEMDLATRIGHAMINYSSRINPFDPSVPYLYIRNNPPAVTESNILFHSDYETSSQGVPLPSPFPYFRMIQIGNSLNFQNPFKQAEKA